MTFSAPPNIDIYSALQVAKPLQDKIWVGVK